MSATITASDRLLIVLLGSIGDVVRGLSVACSIKQRVPDITLGWVVEPKSKDILLHHPAIDQLFVFERSRGISGFIKVAREIRTFNPSVALDLQRHLKSGVLTYLSGAARRIGFHRRNAKEFNWIFQSERIGYESENFSKLKHYLRFIEQLGVEVPQKIDFGLKTKGANKLSFPLPQRYIVFVLGSSWESKDWPTAGYERLTQQVLESGQADVVLIGGKDQELQGKRISSISNRVVNLIGRTTLEQLFPIIAGAKLCIGPDSGPAHMAGALGVRYITLFGPTDPDRVVSFGNEDLVLRSAVPCSPCWRRDCPGLDKVCMRLISPERVWNLARDVLTRD